MIPASKETTIPNIPLDVIEKILLKLPVKSIIRFRSVCKTWFDLSKSSRFTSLHLKETKYQRIVHYFFNQKEKVRSVGHQTRELILYSESLRYEMGQLMMSSNALETTYSNNILFKDDGETCYWFWDFTLVGNCNGIMYITDFANIFRINSSLNEIKKITAPPVELGNSYILCGLGFDHLRDNLKVVLITENFGAKDSKGKAQVYNLSTNSWSEGGQTPTDIDSLNDSSLFFNGVIHWCVDTDDSNCQMLTFNTTNELFQLMNLPQIDTMRAHPSLLVLNQDLLAFASRGSRRDQFVNIWLIKEYGVEESWSKLYSIGPLGNIKEPVSFWEADKLLLRTKDEKLVLYDMPQGRDSINSTYCLS